MTPQWRGSVSNPRGSSSRRCPHTLTLFADGRALAHDTRPGPETRALQDIALARTPYARFVGN
jgi:hypothetical protein